MRSCESCVFPCYLSGRGANGRRFSENDGIVYKI